MTILHSLTADILESNVKFSDQQTENIVIPDHQYVGL